MRDICIIDTETTGLDPERHVILEVAAMRFEVMDLPIEESDAFSCVEVFGGYVRTSRKDYVKAQKKALEVNQIRFDLVENAIPWDVLSESLRECISGAWIIGSNVKYDADMIHSMNKRIQYDGYSPWHIDGRSLVDIRSLAHPLVAQGLESVSIGSLCEWYGWDDGWTGSEFGCFGLRGRQHSAQGDVLRTLYVYTRLMREYSKGLR